MANRSDTARIDTLVPKMIELYEAGGTIRSVAAELGLSDETIRSRLIKAGVQMKSKGSGKKDPNARKRGPNPIKDRSGSLPQSEVDRLRRLMGIEVPNQRMGE